MNRICIYPKDIAIITGKSERSSRDLLKKIKQAFKKKDHQYVTLQEFCKYIGIPVEVVAEKLKG